MERLNGGQRLTTASRVNFPSRMTSTKPRGEGPRSPRRCASAPRRRSASSKRTRAWGSWASAPARLMAVVVFPSSATGLDTATTESSAVRWRCSIRCRSARYCSASNDVGLRRLTRCSSSGDPTGSSASRTGSSAALTSATGAAAGAVSDEPSSRWPRTRSRSACSRASTNLLIGPAERAPRARDRRERPIAGARAATADRALASVGFHRRGRRTRPPPRRVRSVASDRRSR